MKADENTWTIKHQAALDTVLWLTGWMRSGLIRVTIPDLLEMEHRYPGLTQDIDTCVWQVELIKAQANNSNG